MLSLRIVLVVLGLGLSSVATAFELEDLILDTGHSLDDIRTHELEVGWTETGLISGNLQTHDIALVILSTGFAPSISHSETGSPSLALGSTAVQCEHDDALTLPSETCAQDPATADDGIAVSGCAQLASGSGGDLFDVDLTVSFVSGAAWGIPASLYTGTARLSDTTDREQEWGPVYAGPVVQSVQRGFQVEPNEWHFVQVTVIPDQGGATLPSPPSGVWSGSGETENAFLMVEQVTPGASAHAIYLCPSDGVVTPSTCNQVLTCN
ncbi:MAG: hypothetical protein AAF533_02325 [Acidobacteriota bacterium]